MHSDAPAPVSVIGLGPMGRALAGAFLAAGHRTTVWNRTPGKAEELIARGAIEAGNPVEALTAGDVTVSCLIDDDAVESVVDRALADRAGTDLTATTLVNLSADSPRRTGELAERMAELGLGYLDGSIMTPAATIGSDAVSVLYSGPEELFEAHRRTLASLGGKATFVGSDTTRAAMFDVALLNHFWTSISGLMHSFALAQKQDVAASEIAPFAQDMAGLVGSLVPELAREIDSGTFSGADSASLDSTSVSMHHIVLALAEAGVSTRVTASAKELVDSAVSAGHGGDAPTRLAEFLVRSGNPDDAVGR